MSTSPARAQAGAGPRSRASSRLKRQLGRFCPRYRQAVSLVAARHRALADLAWSFPGLLFAIAVPRVRIDMGPVAERAVAGSRLVGLATQARLPLWLRGLPPEAFVEPIGALPDGPWFRRSIPNHLPRKPQFAPVWLKAVARAAEWATEDLALWIARELAGASGAVELPQLRRIALWAWFSARPDTAAAALMDSPWRPEMSFAAARSAAAEWLGNVALHLELDTRPIEDMWLEPGSACGFDFVPILSAQDLRAEAQAMRNCVKTYGTSLAHDDSRLWSVRRQGERVATLEIGRLFGDPFPSIRQLLGPANAPAPAELWWAARTWLNGHDLARIRPQSRAYGEVRTDGARWRALWKPYWLAKRRHAFWLPFVPPPLDELWSAWPMGF